MEHSGVYGQEQHTKKREWQTNWGVTVLAQMGANGRAGLSWPGLGRSVSVKDMVGAGGR